MGRGFLSGLFWGGIVSLVALFVSNQALDRQTLSFPRPEAAAVEVPGGSEFNQARPETDPVMPATDTRPEGDSVVGVAVPDDDVTTPPSMDTAALEVPVPSTSQDAPDSLGVAPDAVADVAEPEAATDRAVETAATDALVQPEAPGAAPGAVVVDIETPEPTGEEQEPAPVATLEEGPAAETGPEVAALPEAGADPVQTAPEAAPQVAGQTEAPAEPSAPEASPQAELPWLERLRASQVDQAPDAPELPTVTAEPSLPPVNPDTAAAPVAEDSASTTPAVPDDAVAAAVEEAMTPETGATTDGTQAQENGSFLQPVETLTERDEDTGGLGDGELPVVRRLGDSSAEEEEAADPAILDIAGDSEAEAEPEAEAVDIEATDGPALSAYATAYEAPEGMPLLSIILVHQGEAALSPELLDILPPHVGFAVDAGLPGAAEIARAYRAAGREVVMIPALPAGAAPQDIEQALAANFDLVPEAVAVMDVSGSSFQSDRDAVAQVVDVVAASGHGMITFPRGLNTAHQAAQRAGVPTGLIFRNLDAASEDQETIRRNLDRAAFRARQDEAVILVGTTGSTMLSALTEWVLGNRAATIAIAPISAALNG